MVSTCRRGRTGAAALVSLQRTRPHLVIADIQARGLRMRELGKMLAQSDDGIPLVLVGSERSTLAGRRAAMLNGAFDDFEYPAEIELPIERAQQLVMLRQKIDQLRADADLDSLTDPANRRRFASRLRARLNGWRRYRVPCALLMPDIDHLEVDQRQVWSSRRRRGDSPDCANAERGLAR